MPEKQRIVKRYANRKLYDTVDSRYITLEQIAALIRQGEDVVVVDKNTDEDLTSVTLAQIIFEEEKLTRGFLPLAALRRVIQTGGESVTDLVNQIGESAERVGRVFRRDEAGRDEAGPENASEQHDVSGMVREWADGVQRRVDDWQRRADNTLHQIMEGLSPLAPMHKEVEQLGQRVAELERRWQALEHATEPTRGDEPR